MAQWRCFGTLGAITRTIHCLLKRFGRFFHGNKMEVCVTSSDEKPLREPQRRITIRCQIYGRSDALMYLGINFTRVRYAVTS